MSTSSTTIAAELREQIVSGALRPGDPLPSAREIVRTRHVAVATASRVHALLRAEGLALPVPGVGTIVAGDRNVDSPRFHARPPKNRSAQPAGQGTVPLNAEWITAAGIAVADAEGLEMLSMRRVAHLLRTQPTSLYRHVTSKEDLVTRMMERALRKWSPGASDGDWRDRLIAGHRELWRVFRRHPWLAPQLSVTRPQLLPAALAFAEWAIQTFRQAGISAEEAFEAHLLLFTQMRGMAILLEPEAEAEATSGIDADTWVDERMTTLRDLSYRNNHAGLQALVGSGYELDLDRLFERGLGFLLDGINSRLRS
ncbi:TetR/AcrR family transcriptional regulator C-terminal domain-containing protein [Brevibacterium epidermidis]|uniref:TetR/AcrR family transcriptional regulator C-terminal domain-containing protein n=1 Tax=Brevibacterium epidermidis TaxID=1698 RepID=UPI000AD93626|nr:TetR/AcrR family transcriptional regulator C-terminal domain-containing protein [Brevibacterium epidermidis]